MRNKVFLHVNKTPSVQWRRGKIGLNQIPCKKKAGGNAGLGSWTSGGQRGPGEEGPGGGRGRGVINSRENFLRAVLMFPARNLREERYILMFQEKQR
jgi:hypothetical protein